LRAYSPIPNRWSGARQIAPPFWKPSPSMANRRMDSSRLAIAMGEDDEPNHRCPCVRPRKGTEVAGLCFPFLNERRPLKES
jgi:hypothetical protein